MSDKEMKTQRFNMFMSPSEMKAIDDWAWQNRIPSKSEAVRRLCQIGLGLDQPSLCDQYARTREGEDRA